MINKRSKIYIAGHTGMVGSSIGIKKAYSFFLKNYKLLVTE